MKPLNIENKEFKLILDEFEDNPLETLATVSDAEGVATVSLNAHELLKIRDWINERIEEVAAKK